MDRIKESEDYKGYVKRFAECRGITEEEAEKHYIVREYALMLYIFKGGKFE